MAPKRQRPSISEKAGGGAKSAAPTAPPEALKKFSAGVSTSNRGQKIIVYGGSGIGKSSLVALAPTPIFIPLDDGSVNLRDPYTNEKVQQVQDADGNPPETFAETRAALQQYSIYDKFDTVVIDTATKLQDLSHQYMFDTIPHEKGNTVTSIEGYGYGKGYNHLYDVMKLILQDADELIRRGKTVVIIVQCTVAPVANAAGDDYVCDAPRLYPGNKITPSIRDMYIEWADHVLFVNHANTAVKDKKIKGAVTRAVFTQGQLHFKAKTRVLASGEVIPAIINFDDVKDDSIWQFIFPEGDDDANDTPPIP